MVNKFLAAIAGALASSVASGGDWRVIIASIATAIAVYLVPNTPPSPPVPPAPTPGAST